jgi:hypothetical protein
MTTPTHPEDLLAPYVDGSLGNDGRAAVDAHLAGCDRCRDEVDLARRARTALSGLPDLEVPPGTVRPGLTPRRAARERLRRASWVTGAAAASIAAITAIVLLNSGHGGGPSPAAAPERGVPHINAIVRQSGSNYDAAGIGRLADVLAGREKRDEAAQVASGSGTSSGGTGAGTATTTNPTTTSGPLSGSSFNAPRTSPAACVRHGASLPRATKPIRPLIAAKFQGTPVYIGAAVEGSALRVWVVARQTCSVLFQTSRQLR